MKVYVLCTEDRRKKDWFYEAVFSSREAAEDYLGTAASAWFRSAAFSRWESDWLGDATNSYRWLIFEEDI